MMPERLFEKIVDKLCNKIDHRLFDPEPDPDDDDWNDPYPPDPEDDEYD